MTTKQTTYSASELERYLVGELDGERSAAIERAAEEDADLKAWIRERQAERDAFLLDPKRKPFAELVREAGAEPKKSWLSTWMPFVSMTAVVAVTVVLFVRPSERTSGIRPKGVAPTLSVTAAVLDGERPKLFDGSRSLHPGDRLRLSIDDKAGGYVTVLLEEQSGAIEVLYSAAELGRVNPGELRLPGSLELDDRLGRERIYVLVSDDLPNVDVWVAEISKANKQGGFEHTWLPEGTTRVSTVEYEKVK